MTPQPLLRVIQMFTLFYEEAQKGPTMRLNMSRKPQKSWLKLVYRKRSWYRLTIVFAVQNLLMFYSRSTAVMVTPPNSIASRSKSQTTLYVSCPICTSCSSTIDHSNQARQLESSETSPFIMGVMIESNLEEGRQDIPSGGIANLKYGQSVTDACIAWADTVKVLDRLREGVKERRTGKWKQASKSGGP